MPAILRPTWVNHLILNLQSFLPEHPYTLTRKAKTFYPYGTSGCIPPTYINCHSKRFWNRHFTRWCPSCGQTNSIKAL